MYHGDWRIWRCGHRLARDAIRARWAYLGGALGVTFVLGSIVAIPQVGVVVVICAAILGQMVGSYLSDTLGWFGVERVPFNLIRLSGIVLLVLGVLLVQRK